MQRQEVIQKIVDVQVSMILGYMPKTDTLQTELLARQINLSLVKQFEEVLEESQLELEDLKVLLAFQQCQQAMAARPLIAEVQAEMLVRISEMLGELGD